jgi:tape measure domain-containing protein
MAVIEYMNVVLGMQTQKFDGDVDKAIKKVDQLGSSFKSTFMGTMAGNIAFKGLEKLTTGMVDFGKNSIMLAADAESAAVAFEVLTGSAEKAATLIANMRRLDMESPLAFTDFQQAAKTMIGFGVSTEDVIKRLSQLSAISMGNAERFQTLSLAFSQTSAAGRLMGQEVLQFVNSGFNPLQQVSKLTGVSMAELKKRMEEGAISVELVGKAFDAATSAGGLFDGMNKRISETTSGQIAKLQGDFKKLSIAVGNELVPVLKETVALVRDLTNDGSIKSMASTVKGAVRTLRGQTMTPSERIQFYAEEQYKDDQARIRKIKSDIDKIDAKGREGLKSTAKPGDPKKESKVDQEAVAMLRAGEIAKKQEQQREAHAKRMAEMEELRIKKQSEFLRQQQADWERLQKERTEKQQRAMDMLAAHSPFRDAVDNVAEALGLMNEGFFNPQQFDFLARREARDLAEQNTVERRDTPTAMAGSVEAYRIFLERDQDRAKEREIAMKSERHLEALLNEAKNRPSLGVARR